MNKFSGILIIMAYLAFASFSQESTPSDTIVAKTSRSDQTYTNLSGDELQRMQTHLENLERKASELQNKAEERGLADSNTDEMIALDNLINKAIRNVKNGEYEEAENHFESSLALGNRLLTPSKKSKLTDLNKETIYNQYQVNSGDSLWLIASRKMENSFLWPLIWEANRKTIPNPDFIKPGTILLIPAR